VRFLVITGVLLLGALGLCGCSSPSIPSWATATLKSEYRAEMHIAGTSHRKRTHIARPIVNEAKADKSKISDRKLYNDVAFTGSVPSKFQYLKPFSEEWKQRQEEDARRMKAATTICRC
jgi:hypothetical protein